MTARRGDVTTAFGAIAEALDEPAGRVTFVRGLMLGTLVGAAVVGSLLRARQARRPSARLRLPADTATAPIEGEGEPGS